MIGFAAIAQKCATLARAREISVELGISNQLQWLVYQGAMLIGAMSQAHKRPEVCAQLKT